MKTIILGLLVLGAALISDLRALFTYLRSLPAVKNHVPVPNVPPEVIDKMLELNKREART